MDRHFKIPPSFKMNFGNSGRGLSMSFGGNDNVELFFNTQKNNIDRSFCPRLYRTWIPPPKRNARNTRIYQPLSKPSNQIVLSLPGNAPRFKVKNTPVVIESDHIHNFKASILPPDRYESNFADNPPTAKLENYRKFLEDKYQSYMQILDEHEKLLSKQDYEQRNLVQRIRALKNNVGEISDTIKNFVQNELNSSDVNYSPVIELSTQEPSDPYSMQLASKDNHKNISLKKLEREYSSRENGVKRRESRKFNIPVREKSREKAKRVEVSKLTNKVMSANKEGDHETSVKHMHSGLFSENILNVSTAGNKHGTKSCVGTSANNKTIHDKSSVENVLIQLTESMERSKLLFQALHDQDKLLNNSQKNYIQSTERFYLEQQRLLDQFCHSLENISDCSPRQEDDLNRIEPHSSIGKRDNIIEFEEINRSEINNHITTIERLRRHITELKNAPEIKACEKRILDERLCHADIRLMLLKQQFEIEKAIHKNKILVLNEKNNSTLFSIQDSSKGKREGFSSFSQENENLECGTKDCVKSNRDEALYNTGSLSHIIQSKNLKKIQDISNLESLGKNENFLRQPNEKKDIKANFSSTKTIASLTEMMETSIEIPVRKPSASFKPPNQSFKQTQLPQTISRQHDYRSVDKKEILPVIYEQERNYQQRSIPNLITETPLNNLRLEQTAARILKFPTSEEFFESHSKETNLQKQEKEIKSVKINGKTKENVQVRQNGKKQYDTKTQENVELSLDNDLKNISEPSESEQIPEIANRVLSKEFLCKTVINQSLNHYPSRALYLKSFYDGAFFESGNFIELIPLFIPASNVKQTSHLRDTTNEYESSETQEKTYQHEPKSKNQVNISSNHINKQKLISENLRNKQKSQSLNTITPHSEHFTNKANVLKGAKNQHSTEDSFSPSNNFQVGSNEPYSFSTPQLENAKETPRIPHNLKSRDSSVQRISALKSIPLNTENQYNTSIPTQSENVRDVQEIVSNEKDKNSSKHSFSYPGNAQVNADEDADKVLTPFMEILNFDQRIRNDERHDLITPARRKSDENTSSLSPRIPDSKFSPEALDPTNESSALMMQSGYLSGSDIDINGDKDLIKLSPMSKNNSKESTSRKDNSQEIKEKSRRKKIVNDSDFYDDDKGVNDSSPMRLHPNINSVKKDSNLDDVKPNNTFNTNIINGDEKTKSLKVLGESEYESFTPQAESTRIDDSLQKEEEENPKIFLLSKSQNLSDLKNKQKTERLKDTDSFHPLAESTRIDECISDESYAYDKTIKNKSQNLSDLKNKQKTECLKDTDSFHPLAESTRIDECISDESYVYDKTIKNKTTPSEINSTGKHRQADSFHPGPRIDSTGTEANNLVGHGFTPKASNNIRPTPPKINYNYSEFVKEPHSFKSIIKLKSDIDKRKELNLNDTEAINKGIEDKNSDGSNSSPPKRKEFHPELYTGYTDFDSASKNENQTIKEPGHFSTKMESSKKQNESFFKEKVNRRLKRGKSNQTRSCSSQTENINQPSTSTIVKPSSSAERFLLYSSYDNVEIRPDSFLPTRYHNYSNCELRDILGIPPEEHFEHQRYPQHSLNIDVWNAKENALRQLQLSRPQSWEDISKYISPSLVKEENKMDPGSFSYPNLSDSRRQRQKIDKLYDDIMKKT